MLPDDKSDVGSEVAKPKKRVKRLDPAAIASLEEAQKAINGNIDRKLSDVERDRQIADELERKKAEFQEKKNTEKKKNVLDVWQTQVQQAKDEQMADKRRNGPEKSGNDSDRKSVQKPSNPKMDRIQNWVNNIDEEKPKQNGGEPKKPPKTAGPPKVKQKYTTAGRRTSSMSGIEISKTSKELDLSNLPQPADLRVPFASSQNLTPKTVQQVATESVAESVEDWTLLQLQNGMDNSESSSYELINSSDVDDELEQVTQERRVIALGQRPKSEFTALFLALFYALRHFQPLKHFAFDHNRPPQRISKRV